MAGRMEDDVETTVVGDTPRDASVSPAEAGAADGKAAPSARQGRAAGVMDVTHTGTVTRLGTEPLIKIEGFGEIRFAYRNVKKRPSEPKPILALGDVMECRLANTAANKPKAIALLLVSAVEGQERSLHGGGTPEAAAANSPPPTAAAAAAAAGVVSGDDGGSSASGSPSPSHKKLAVARPCAPVAGGGSSTGGGGGGISAPPAVRGTSDDGVQRVGLRSALRERSQAAAAAASTDAPPTPSVQKQQKAPRTAPPPVVARPAVLPVTAPPPPPAAPASAASTPTPAPLVSGTPGEVESDADTSVVFTHDPYSPDGVRIVTGSFASPSQHSHSRSNSMMSDNTNAVATPAAARAAVLALPFSVVGTPISTPIAAMGGSFGRLAPRAADAGERIDVAIRADSTGSDDTWRHNPYAAAGRPNPHAP